MHSGVTGRGGDGQKKNKDGCVIQEAISSRVAILVDKLIGGISGRIPLDRFRLVCGRSPRILLQGRVLMGCGVGAVTANNDVNSTTGAVLFQSKEKKLKCFERLMASTS